MSYSQAFVCLSYLFSDAGFEERDHDEKYTYFTKNGVVPIQINRLKQKYSHLELSSYAVRVGQKSDVFIDKYETAMEILNKLADSKPK